MRRVTDLRAEYFSIGDLCAGRMPLAYVQFVQILVDSLVWLAPLSLYPGLGSLSILLCAVLTHFFKGLLELSKSFLDPFGNDGYPGQNIRYVPIFSEIVLSGFHERLTIIFILPQFQNCLCRVDVLVSELNFGAASRWVDAAKRVPVPSRESPGIKASHRQPDSSSDGHNFHPL